MLSFLKQEHPAMDGWMDGWTDKCMDEWDEQMDGWMMDDEWWDGLQKQKLQPLFCRSCTVGIHRLMSIQEEHKNTQPWMEWCHRHILQYDYNVSRVLGAVDGLKAALNDVGMVVRRTVVLMTKWMDDTWMMDMLSTLYRLYTYVCYQVAWALQRQKYVKIAIFFTASWGYIFKRSKKFGQDWANVIMLWVSSQISEWSYVFSRCPSDPRSLIHLDKWRWRSRRKACPAPGPPGRLWSRRC